MGAHRRAPTAASLASMGLSCPCPRYRVSLGSPRPDGAPLRLVAGREGASGPACASWMATLAPARLLLASLLPPPTSVVVVEPEEEEGGWTGVAVNLLRALA
jgi:hypothetical protein